MCYTYEITYRCFHTVKKQIRCPKRQSSGQNGPCTNPREIDDGGTLISIDVCRGRECFLSKKSGIWNCCTCRAEGNEHNICSGQSVTCTHPVCWQCMPGKRKEEHQQLFDKEVTKDRSEDLKFAADKYKRLLKVRSMEVATVDPARKKAKEERATAENGAHKRKEQFEERKRAQRRNDR